MHFNDMKIKTYAIVKVSPPKDSWLFINIKTDSEYDGWGEITGSGHDTAVAAIAAEALQALLGKALDLEACMKPFYDFRYPLLRGKIFSAAWSGINQALWDIYAQSCNLPLAMLWGAGRTQVPLYANLNRGLFTDRSAKALASNASHALKAGFSMVKATPFDELDPGQRKADGLQKGLDRLASLFSEVDANKVSLDCHTRFSPQNSRVLMDFLSSHKPLCWIEDIFPNEFKSYYKVLKQKYPWFVHADGEEIVYLEEFMDLMKAENRPDIFMPDVKFICGLEDIKAMLKIASRLNVNVSLHNPSGPISTAFSAHLAAIVFDGTPIEYCFDAVPDRSNMLSPKEPIEKGVYYLTEKSGIGIKPGAALLNDYGVCLAKG